jgi:molecular chaperone GrpE
MSRDESDSPIEPEAGDVDTQADAQSAAGEPTTGEPSEAETSEVDTRTDLEKAQAEAAENHDRYLRSVAELDNFRKRTVKMRSETRDSTLRDVLLQIGPMLDNFRRALGQESDDVASFRQGIDIIFKQFNDILSGYGLVEIAAEGQPFDPNLHEAMAQVPSAEHPPGTVIKEMEKGYTLNDKIVRPTRVVVSTEMAEPGPNMDAGADTGLDNDDQAVD